MVDYDNFWRGRRVLITGHTGFKGAWLALWLEHLGAEVCALYLAGAGVARLSIEPELMPRVEGLNSDVRLDDRPAPTVVRVPPGAPLACGARAARAVLAEALRDA